MASRTVARRSGECGRGADRLGRGGDRGYARAVSALGCESPVMQAPVGRGAGPRLAVAVSEAGGLGTLGASWTPAPVLREQIRMVGRETDRPFCVNLVLDFAQEE